MAAWQALLQGIIQGLSEFLPISSSGHLSLFQYFTGQSGEEGAFFSVLLHLGTLAAVFIAFRRTIWSLLKEFFSMLRDIVSRKFSWRGMRPERRMIFLILVALLPMTLSFLCRDFFEQFSTDNSIFLEGLMFLLTSLLLFLGVRYGKGRKNAESMSFRDAAIVGAVQAVAPLPALSRSGSTISTGLLRGIDKEFAVAFSFIIGIPPILGANLLEIPAVLREGLTIPVPYLLLGLAASFVFGLLAIKLVKLLVTSNKFKYFAVYTLILGILITAIGLYEDLAGHRIQQAIVAWLR